MMMFYQRFTVLMMIVKLLMSADGFTKFACFDPDVIVPPAQVFYSSAACANVLGRSRSVWLFKGLPSNSKLNNRYRLLTVLRLLLLIAAGDVESNPGPNQNESFNQTLPEPEASLQTSYPCVKCGENTDSDDCVCCEYCLRWEHNHCSNLTRSMAREIAKYPNLIYMCDDCTSAGAMAILRRMSFKLKERAISFGKLLDLYDASLRDPKAGQNNLPMATNASTQTTLIQSEPAPDQPQSSSQQTIVNEATTSTTEETPVQATNSSGGDESVLIVDKDVVSCPKSGPVIVKGRQDPRSNFYMFTFTFNGVSYRSLEHAYQSLKAVICGDTSLAWRIRHAPSPQVAKKLADRLPRIAMKSLHDLMFDLLKAKISQCYSFRQSLRKTGSNRIFHSTYKNVDLYWCTGLDYRDLDGHNGEYEGLNVFGKMLEEIRDEYLLAEENYETSVRCLEADSFVVVLHDGEENFVHDQVFRSRGSGYHRYLH
jgi:ribA/ribD-fused uncharacterized protein